MENCSKLVSLIIPVYNKGEYLAECLKSIDKQVYRNFEVLLIDDGSTDISAKICDDYYKANSNAKVFHTSNRGASEARNFGIEHAKGDYIVFIDADDILGNYYLEVLVNLMQKSNESMAIIGHGKKSVNDLCSSPNIDNAKIIDVDEVYNNLIRNEQIRGYVWNKIFNRSIIEENGIRFFPDTKIWEDMDFVLNYMQYIQNAYFCDKNHYYYRKIPANNISSDVRLERIEMAKRIFEFNRDGCIQFHEDAKRFYVVTILAFCWTAYKNHVLDKAIKKYYLDEIENLNGIKCLDFISIIKLYIMLMMQNIWQIPAKVLWH